MTRLRCEALVGVWQRVHRTATGVPPIAIEAMAAAVIALSFMKWVDLSGLFGCVGVHGEPLACRSQLFAQVHGDDVDRISSFGDGFITATLGIVAFAAAVSLRVTDRRRWLSTATLGVAGFSIFGVALLVAVSGWSGAGDPVFLQAVAHRDAALWVILALGLIMGAVAFAALSPARRLCQTTTDGAPPVLDAGAHAAGTRGFFLAIAGESMAAAVVALSFMKWIDLGPLKGNVPYMLSGEGFLSIRGDNVDRISSLGDGSFTAILGVVAFGAAVLMSSTGRLRRLLPSVIAVAGFAIFAVATFVALMTGQMSTLPSPLCTETLRYGEPSPPA